ncbi:MAG: DUF1285 domain-containing protein [Alphaproteobacteria bacterium]|jgi:hypothetical protein
MANSAMNYQMAENVIDALKACGEGEFRITKDGVWHHQGTQIPHINMVKLFATILRRDETGQYWLVTPSEKVRVLVDDAPFVAVDLRVEGVGQKAVVSLKTNLDEWVRMDLAHPLNVRDTDRGPRPYIGLGKGDDGEMSALIARPVYYALVDMAEKGNHDTNGIWSMGHFFSLMP